MRKSTLLSAVLLLIVSLCIFGCAPNTIKGTEKQYDVTINIHNNAGPVTLTSPLKVESASETTQDANPSTVISPETALAMPSGGSTASIAAQAATQSLKDIASKLVNDASKKNSENPTTNTTTTPAAVTPAVVPVKPVTGNEDNEKMPEASTGTTADSDDLAYTKKTEYESYGKRNGDRYAWRINKKGTDFGQPIKIVFSPSGKSFTVNDTSKNCRDRADTCNRDKSADMYGFVFKPGIGPNGAGDANAGTSHGGVYLQGPYGLADQKVTIYHNEQ